MEAAQHRVPTVGYSFGLRDSVRDQVTGRLVETPAQLLEATRDLIADSAERERLGAGAEEFAAQFSWETTGRRFKDLLERVTGTTSAR